MNESIDDEFPNVAESAEDAWEETSESTSDALARGKEFIQANQIPVVLGALAAGLVLGLLVPRKKPEPPISKLEGRLEELKDLLGSLGSKVSDTAEDHYDGVSSAIGSAIKKAKKHFNIS